MKSKGTTVEKLARIICKDSSNHGECEKCGFYTFRDCSKFAAAERILNAGFVQVVRCKDCINCNISAWDSAFRTLINDYVEKYDFCPYGKVESE